MNEPVTFSVPQLNGDAIKKSGEISSAFATLQRTIVGVLGNSPDIHIINQKLQEAWMYTNNALVTTARRVAA